MEQNITVDQKIPRQDLPLFDGFPYLTSWISPAFYHYILLPQDKSARYLQDIAATQAWRNDLRACLVLAPRECYYYATDGTPTRHEAPPRGGIAVFDKLALSRRFPITAELAVRKLQLIRFAGERSGYIFGDLTKGGRSATHDEIRELAGTQVDGVPVGLVRCSQCNQWKGECLDPSPHFLNQIMAVHCFCDNRNRCAACGDLLYRYKLNANYFEEADGQIWHVPGFSAFEHRCPEVIRQTSQAPKGRMRMDLLEM